MKKYRAQTLTDLLTAITTLGLLAAIFLPSLLAQREDTRESLCADRLRTLAAALRQYADEQSLYPRGGVFDPNVPDGRGAETFSWFAHLLPFHGEMELFEKTDFKRSPMSAENASYRTARIETHECPADITAVSRADEPNFAVRRSNYIGNLGNTNFGQNDCTGWQGREPYPFGGAPFSFVKSVRPNEILDGEANTIAFSECVVNPNTTLDRGDYGLARLGAGCGFTSYNGPNTTASTDAGRKAAAADDFDPPFVGYESGFPLSATIPAKSRHVGGVNTAMLDGSVRFVADSIELAVWQEMTAASDKTKAKIDPQTFDERLLTDWIYQDHGKNVNECFVSDESNNVEAAMTRRVLDELAEGDSADYAMLFERREKLLAGHISGNDTAWKTLYVDLCKARRAERLAVVVEEAPEIIYTKLYVLGGSHYTYTEDTTDPTYVDISTDRKPGGGLWKMTVAPDGSVTHEPLFETPNGAVRDPDVSFDAKKIIFSTRDNFKTDDFHLAEYNLETKSVRKLTSAAGFADIEPVYLPNGEMVFVSSRCMRIVDCWRTEVSNLYTCDADGRFLRRIGYDQVTTNYPKMLNDGRVIYTRWEYQDRGQIFPQPLFVMNADGTGQTEYYGNNSFFPTTIVHARPIPDSSKVVAVSIGHHTHQRGKLILIDRNRGTQEADGVEYLAPRRTAKPLKLDQADQEGDQFQYPFALDEHNYLVGYSPEGFSTVYGLYRPTFGIYWFDDEGNRELLAWDQKIGSSQPIALRKREIPATRPSQVNGDKATGTFYVQDVYQGPGLTGVERGTVRYLRVVEPIFDRPFSVRGNSNSGPAGNAFVATPMSVENGAWDSKRVLGDVPVEADGSVYFEVPSETPVYFQLLDERRRVVQTMRSWSTLMSGEFFACVGCHEAKSNTPAEQNPSNPTASLALAKPPVPMRSPLAIPDGPHKNAGFSFIRDVQPILDSKCVSCHDGRTEYDGVTPMDLTGDLYDRENGPYKITDAGRAFSKAYIYLTQGGKQNEYVNWLNMQSVPSMLPAYDSGAVKSGLITMFLDSERKSADIHHRDVALSDDELAVLSMWIDLAIPFCGFTTEANLWTEAEWGEFAYYRNKQNAMKKITDANRQLWADVKAGRAETPSAELIPFTAGGGEVKKAFLEAWPKRELPNACRKSGSENTRRNLALNPFDTWEKGSYPHASSNSENAYAADSLAVNAIDGKRGSGAWRCGRRTDASLHIEFGHKTEVTEAVVTLAEGTPWREAELIFSDGTRVPLVFDSPDQPQRFEFEKMTTTDVTFVPRAERPLEAGGVTELEIWGVSSEPTTETKNPNVTQNNP